MEQEQDDPGTKIMEHCLICSETSENIDLIRRHLQVKFLLLYVTPIQSSELVDVESKCNFCQNCGALLEQLGRLEEVLESTRKDIDSTLMKIKLSIVQSIGKTNRHACVQTLRRSVIKEFCPRVHLTKINPTIPKKRPRITTVQIEIIKKERSESSVPSSLHFTTTTEQLQANDEEIFSQDDVTFTDVMAPEIILNCKSEDKQFETVEEALEFEPWAADQQAEQKLYGLQQTNDNGSSNLEYPKEYLVDSYEDQQISLNGFQFRETIANKVWSRPNLTTSHLAFLAIKNGSAEGMLVHDIIQFIQENFPYYRTAKNWKFLLRNALSCNPCFYARDRGELNGKTAKSMSGLWNVDDEKITWSFKSTLYKKCEEKFLAYPERLNKLLNSFQSCNQSNENATTTSTSSTRSTVYRNLYGMVNEHLPSIDSTPMLPLQSRSKDPTPVLPLQSPSLLAQGGEGPQPNIKLTYLAVIATLNQPNREANVQQVFDFVSFHYPFFDNPTSWKWSFFTSMNCSCYFAGQTPQYHINSIGADKNFKDNTIWTVHYAEVKHMILKIAETLKKNEQYMRHPERLYEILRPLFENELSYSHLIYWALNSSSSGTLNRMDICNYIRDNFAPFCKKDGFLLSSKIFDNLMNSEFFKLTDNLMWSAAETAKNRLQKELEYIMLTTPQTFYKAATHPETMRNIVELS